MTSEITSGGVSYHFQMITKQATTLRLLLSAFDSLGRGLDLMHSCPMEEAHEVKVEGVPSRKPKSESGSRRSLKVTQSKAQSAPRRCNGAGSF